MTKPKETFGYSRLMTCRKCGKEFFPAPMHRFRKDEKWYCSWTCYNHRNDKQEMREDE